MTLKRFMIGWLVVSVVIFLLMLTHTSKPASLGGRYSPSYFVTLVAMLWVMLAAVVGVSRSLWLGKLLARIPATQRAGWLLAIGGALLAGITAVTLSRGSDPAPVLFQVYMVTLVVVGTQGLLWFSGAGKHILPDSIHWGLLILPIGLLIVLAVLYISRVPAALFFDEPALTALSQVITTPESPRSLLYGGHSNINFALNAWGSLLPFGYWLRVTGIGFESARLFWLVIGALGAPFVYFTAQRLYGRTAAIGAFAVALLLPLAHNYIRGDTFVALALSVALYTFFKARENNSPLWHFVTGFTVALSVEGHQYGARFALVFGVYYLAEYAYRLYQARRWQWNPGFWAFAAGGSLFVLFYIWLHVIYWGNSDPFVAVSALMRSYISEADLSAGTSLTDRVIAETQAWLANYMTIHPLEAAIATLGLIAAFVRRSEPDRILLALLLPSTAIFLVLQAHYNPYYWIHNLPFIALLGGGLFAQVSGVLHSKTINIAFVGIIGTILLLAALYYVDTGAKTGQSAYPLIEVSREVDALLPDEVDAVAGWPVYYFGLSERRFAASRAFVAFPMEEWPENNLYPPQAVIVTLNLDNYAQMQDYIVSAGLVKVQCFRLSEAGAQAILYVLPQYAPSSEAINCK